MHTDTQGRMPREGGEDQMNASRARKARDHQQPSEARSYKKAFYIHIYIEIYYKESALVIIEAEKSQSLLF